MEDSSKKSHPYNYGEEIENELIRIGLESNARDTIRENTNLLGAIKHVKKVRPLNSEETLRCMANIAILEKEIEASKIWLDTLQDWRVKRYN